jgi:phospholipid transport system substrate-binding protein
MLLQGKMMRKIFTWLFGVALVAVMFGARADIPAPDVLIRDTAQEVLAVVKQDKDIQAGNQKKVLDLVEAKVLPHFDFESITQTTVGKKKFLAATPEQRKALVNEFRTLMVRTYTVAFSRYRNQSVEVKPPRMKPDDVEVTIRTQIVKPGEPSIAVDYDMEKTDKGWKVVDLKVEGASMIASYHGTFAEKIHESGIDGLIQFLEDKNHSNAKEPLHKADAK